MKIAILGGGLTGLTAGYELAKKGYQVTIYEKEPVLGGLASGFKTKDWDWYLERTYHHIFSSDSDILGFAKEINFNEFFFKTPLTASLYNNFKTYPLDTPIDLLRFPLLGMIDKIRSGLIIAFLKLSPFLPIYEQLTSIKFLEKFMGKKSYNTLFQQLFRGKYGKYAGIILASFIWARIKKRTKSLGYVKGGFQELINYLETCLVKQKVKIIKNYNIKDINKSGDKFLIDNQPYDKVISTLPTPILTKVAKKILSVNYLKKLKLLKYLHAITLIIETDKPILNQTYWLNISVPTIPIMGIVQHTNYIDKKNYNGKHIAYLGWYVDDYDKKLKMSDKQLLDYVKPYLKTITNNQYKISNYYVFKSYYGQPIFDKTFINNKPNFITPTKNFYIANLDMTYPYDRGTNYAVKLGKDISKLIY